MDASTNNPARIFRVRLHADLVGETRVEKVRESLAEKSPSWRAAQDDPFALLPKADDDIPF